MVIFVDLDGTLVDSLPLLYSIYCQFMKRFGLQGSQEEFAEISGPSLKEGIAYLKTKHNLAMDPEIIFADSLKAIRARYCHEVELFPGALAFLSAAKERKIRTALVTSSDGKSAEIILKRCGVHAFFEAIVSADGLIKAKPDPAIYQEALRVMNVHPTEAYAIEDAPNGIIAASRAGLQVIAMAHRNPTRAPGAKVTIHSWEEARALLETIG